MQIIIESNKSENEIREDLLNVADEIAKILKEGNVSIEVKNISEEKTRTFKQNRAMRKGWQLGAFALNENGWTKIEYFKSDKQIYHGMIVLLKVVCGDQFKKH